MHFLGLEGMPRRTFTYDGNMGWNLGNYVSTMGALTLGIGLAIYLIAMVYAYYKGPRSHKDPWDARTLEWSLPNPPPEYNFQVLPTVHARDGWWYEKHHKEEIAKEEEEHAQAEEAHGGIHMPFQSIYPFLAGVGILIGAIGVSLIDPADPKIYTGFFGPKIVVTMLGGLFMFISVVLWSIEGADGTHIHLNPDGSVKGEESHGGYGKH
jgi:cytochrome c oxidase subunit 1